MKTTRLVPLIAFLSACGPAGSPSSTGASAAAASLDQAASAVSSTAGTYQASTPTLNSASACAAAAQHYGNQMRPHVDQVTQVAGQLDAALGTMGWMAHADVQCGASVLGQELERHLAVACGLPDMASNRAEIEQHLATMQDYANHMRMRAAEVIGLDQAWSGGTAGGTGGWMGGGMGGTSGWNMGMGWTMPGGGMMNWDDHMPGCGLGGPTGPTWPANPTP